MAEMGSMSVIVQYERILFLLTLLRIPLAGGQYNW